MRIKELRIRTGFSQREFAEAFNIPLSTIKDWEIERRTPPEYVLEMIQELIEFKGLCVNDEYLKACDQRMHSVNRAIAVVVSATNMPTDSFLDGLEDYIIGKISLEELERKVDALEYL